MGLLIFGSVLGLMLAVVALLAIWLALGSWTIFWRAMPAIAGVSGAAFILCGASGELEAEWLGLLWVVAVAVTTAFALVRWLGFRLVDSRIHKPLRADEMQFSLAQLMGFTAIAAAVAAVARMLAPSAATLDILLFGLGIAVCLGSLALVAAWATLRSAALRFTLPAFAIAAIFMSGLTWYAVEATHADPGIAWGSTVLAYAIALAGLLLLARSRGFRLLLVSEPSPSAGRRAA